MPQGTVLGLLLFSLYINDIMFGIESEICPFTDDYICYHQTDSIEDTSKLQKDIDQLVINVLSLCPKDVKKNGIQGVGVTSPGVC